MKKVLAVAVVLLLGVWNVTLGQDTVTNSKGTPVPDVVKAAPAPAPVKEVKKDVEGAYGTKTLDKQQKAYAAARATAQTAEDFVACARLTPFNWVAAWCYLNAAEVAFNANDQEKSADYLKTAREYEGKVAVAFPAKGSNSQARFDKVAAKLEKVLQAQVTDPDSGTD